MLNQLSDQTNELLTSSIIIDGQLGFEPDMPFEFEEKWQLVDRYIKAGFSAITLSIANEESTQENTLSYLAKLLVYLNQHSNKYVLVKNPHDIEKAKKENKLAVKLMFQGTSPLGKNLNMVKLFRDLGITSLILCYNIKTPMGDGVVESVDGGLSHLGKKLIAEMNRVGMLIDLSHTGYKTSREAIEISKHPVIFSHSNAYSIHPHLRNLKDDMIKAVAKTGGYIGINGIGVLLGDEKASPTKVVEHINYISELVGPEHVALGTDYLYFPDEFPSFMKKQSITHPESYAKNFQITWQSFVPEKIPAIIEGLLKTGYSEREIKGILGENHLRVFRKISS